MRVSQQDKILRHLKKGKPITPLEALREYGCMRLAARVYDLRGLGHEIISETVERNGKKIARYRI